jgi:hypothetical protein
MNSLTTFQIVTMLISFAAGVLANAKQTGKFFGFVTEPASWVPYVAIAAAFLPAFGGSLQHAGTISVATLFAALLAGVEALPAFAAGIGAHHVFVVHNLFKKSPPANDNGGASKDTNAQTTPAKPAA